MDIEWLIFAFSLPVIGHVLYGLPPSPDDTDERITLHNGDEFSPTDEAPNPSRMLGLRAISDVGTTPRRAEWSRETGVTVDTSPAAKSTANTSRSRSARPPAFRAC